MAAIEFREKVISRLKEIKLQIVNQEYVKAVSNIQNTIEFLESERTKSKNTGS